VIRIAVFNVGAIFPTYPDEGRGKSWDKIERQRSAYNPVPSLLGFAKEKAL
jgi:hypothetical protein